MFGVLLRYPEEITVYRMTVTIERARRLEGIGATVVRYGLALSIIAPAVRKARYLAILLPGPRCGQNGRPAQSHDTLIMQSHDTLIIRIKQ